ncbi:MAG: helix-turn-helix domain-containing protein [Brevundimonas sp.]
MARDGSPHPIDLHVGRRLAERRQELKMNQSDLGKAIGVTFQQVQKYERGYNRVSASKLWQCAAALGVAIHYFYPDTDTPVEVVETPSPTPTPRTREMSRLYASLDDGAQRVVLNLTRELSTRD